ncbi:MAG: hemolysin family protein [Ignavibacteriaceae bacterium]|nr:hemolysin family protein [Ignavibacteriaceae bacterium]
MIEQLLILIILILLSAFFSSTELAFIVANRLKIEIKAKSKNIAATHAQYFVNNTQDFFSTILISNNVINITFASLSAIYLSFHFGLNEYEVLIVSTLILLFFGELIPKYFAREMADRFVFVVSVPLRLISILLYPFVKPLSHLTNITMRSRRQQADNIYHLFDKEDVKSLVDESHKAGKVKKQEGSFISKVFMLGEQKVYEALTPRTEIVGLEINQTVDEAILTFIESGFSKLPVYEDNLDNIKGVILAKDLFTNPESIKSILREVQFYPETKKSLEILNEFLAQNMSIAVVVDEFGGTAGIVTVEDIIEELFGEIKDEYDVDENICRKINLNSYIISGKVEVDLINEKYHLNIPIGSYETIGGYIIERIGKIPKQGETFLIDDFQLLIIRADKVRIDLVKLIHRVNE